MSLSTGSWGSIRFCTPSRPANNIAANDSNGVLLAAGDTVTLVKVDGKWKVTM